MRIFKETEKLILFFILTCVPLVFYTKLHDPGVIKEFIFKALIVTWVFYYSFKIIKHKRVTISSKHLGFGIVLFLIFSEISFICSKYKVIGLSRIEIIAYFTIFYFLVSQLFHNLDSPYYFLEVVSYTGLITAVYGIAQFFMHYFILHKDFFRVSASLIHPNFLAGYLIAVIPLTLGFFLVCPKSKKKLAYALSLIAQFICLILTLSRSAIISIGVSLLFFSIIWLRHAQKPIKSKIKKENCIYFFLFISLAIFAFLLLINKLPRSEIDRLTTFNKSSKLNTIRMRRLEWKGALELIKKKPIIGYGPGSFSAVFPSNQPSDFASLTVERNEFLRHAHNEYLEIFSETGFLGLITFLYIIFCTLLLGFNSLKVKEGTKAQRHKGTEAEISHKKNENSHAVKGNEKDNYIYFILLGLIFGFFSLCLHMIFSVSYRSLPVGVIFWFYIGAISGFSQCKKEKECILTPKRLYAFTALFFSLFVLLFFSMKKSISQVKSESSFYKGLVDYKAGRLKEALSHMERALDNNKYKPEIYYKKGVVEFQLKKWPQALSTYLALEKIHPDFFHLNYNLSLCYFYLEDYDRAITSGKKQIKLYPEYKEQYCLMAKAFSLNEKYDSAEKYFEKYLQLKSDK